MIQSDKVAHFIAGGTITLISSSLGVPAPIAFGLGVTAGALKEAADATGRGHPSWADFWATVAGSGVISVTIGW